MGTTDARKICPLCEKDLPAQGFGGHMWGVHGVKIGDRAKLSDVQKRVAKLEDDVPTRIAKLEDRMNKLIDKHKLGTAQGLDPQGAHKVGYTE